MLFSVEETVVRSAAAKSCSTILSHLVGHANGNAFLDMFTKICGDEGEVIIPHHRWKRGEGRGGGGGMSGALVF